MVKRSRSIHLKNHTLRLNRSAPRAAAGFGLSGVVLFSTGCSDPIQYSDFSEERYVSLEACIEDNPYQEGECRAAYRRYLAERLTEAQVYATLDACIELNPDTEQLCRRYYEAAQHAAATSSPMFDSELQCQMEYENCELDDNSGFWRPAFMGFLVAEVIDEAGDLYRSTFKHTRSTPLFAAAGQGFRTAGGTKIATGNPRTRIQQRVTEIDRRPRVVHSTTTQTTSRSGFGSTARSTSSWSWGRGRSSWGG